MSHLAMTRAEEKSIDSQIEQMMDWAKTRRAEAEQLALDSARLMACTTDRVDRLKNQGFFKRCWNRFSGKAGEMERANINDIIQMQKTAFRYVNMLQEQQLLMAHSLLSLKNNLISLTVKEEETRNLIAMLAQRTLERFENLENRVDQLEISTNLQGWLLGLEERDYDRKYPTQYMRMFRVINDFYNIKNDGWNYNDLMFMRTALRKVSIDPKRQISLSEFIDNLTDEIQSEPVGMGAYSHAIEANAPKNIEDYSQFAIDNISSPVVVTIHGLRKQFSQTSDIVEILQDELSISASEAQKRILKNIISNMNVNMDYKFTLGETAIEIMSCIRLINNLEVPMPIENDIKSDIIDISQGRINGEKVKTFTSKLKLIADEIEEINQLRKENVTYFLDVKEKNYDSESKQKIKRKSLIEKLLCNFNSIEPIREEMEKEVRVANKLMETIHMKKRVKLPSKPEFSISTDSKASALVGSGWSERKTTKWEHAFNNQAEEILKYISELNNANTDMEELFEY